MAEAFPVGQFRVILADPPWPFRVRSPRGLGRSPEQHYPTMTADEIAALPVASLAAPDCALFLWTTGPQLPLAVDTMRAWGFAYSGVAFVWIKVTKVGGIATGLGYTTRQNAEFCLLGRRGAFRRQSKAVHQVIMARRREHSRKPNVIYQRIEQLVGDAPRIELFARQRWPGWSVWGNQMDRFETAPMELPG